MSSALLLERYFFSRIELRPNLDGKQEGTFTVTCATNIGRAEDDQSRYQITLSVTLSTESSSPANPYYNGTVEIVGFFKIANGFSGDVGKLVQISGSSVLYGAVREMFSNLTARGPWPMVTLPTMNFTPQPEGSSAPVLPAAPTPAAAPPAQ